MDSTAIVPPTALTGPAKNENEIVVAVVGDLADMGRQERDPVDWFAAGD